MYFLFLFLLKQTQVFSQKLILDIRSIDSTENTILKEFNFKKKNHTNKSISEEIDFFSEKLKKHGYLLNKVDSISNENKKTIAFIKLNTKINFVTINSKKKPSLNKTIPFENLEKLLQSISQNEEEKGFLFSETRLENISIRKDTLFANIKITRSEKRKVNKTIIKGYPEFSKKKIDNFLNIRNNEIINNQKLEQISNRIKNLDFISEIKSPEILFKKDSTLLYLYLQKEKDNNFDGIINFASKENDDGLLFTGHLKLNLNNIFNTGENFHLKWEANESESQNLTLSSELPYLFNSPLTTKLNFKLHKQDTTFTSNTSEINLLFNINTKISTGINYNSETSLKTLINESDENYQNFKNNFFGLNFNYANNKLNKLTTYINPSFGKRTSENKTINQFKFLSDILFYNKINPKNAFLIENETGLLFSDSEITNELFRIGGANSIRGFNEETIFTSKYSFIKIEYHYYSSKKTYFYSITDFGFANINSRAEQLFGIGLGFSLSSNNNKFNIATALGKTKKETLNLSNSKIIINFTTYF